MKKTQIVIAFFLFISHCAFAQNVYKSSSSTISFYSYAPLEDIDAVSKSGGAAINFDNNKVFVKVSMKSFKFDNSLMQEHFNDNYMESDKYPYAQYKGVLDQSISPKKNGTYNTTTTGELTLHGVTKKYSVPVKIVVKDGVIKSYCAFKVKLADHKIKIPKIVSKKIATEVTVKINVTYEKN